LLPSGATATLVGLSRWPKGIVVVTVFVAVHLLLAPADYFEGRSEPLSPRPPLVLAHAQPQEPLLQGVEATATDSRGEMPTAHGVNGTSTRYPLIENAKLSTPLIWPMLLLARSPSTKTIVPASA